MHFESERTSLERRQNKTREWRGGTRRDPQLTSRLRPPPAPLLLPLWGFVGPEGPLVRTFAKLCQALSHRTTPSYGHHPQFAFLKGAQKPPEIAAGSSDVTAGSISVPLDRSPLSPLPHHLFLPRSRMPLFFFSFYLSSSSTIDDFTSRYLPRRQEF